MSPYSRREGSNPADRVATKGKLQYFVSWVGYPSDEPDNDTWINEEDAEYAPPLPLSNCATDLARRGAPELVDAYWKSLPAPKRAERTAAPSAKAKSKLAPAKKADAPRSASATLKRGASKLDDSPTEGGRASRGTSGAEKEVVLNGSAVKGNAAKRVKRGEDSPELGTPVKEKAKKAAPVGKKNDGKKAEVKKVEVQKVEQEDEEDEEMDDDEGGDVDGHKHVRHELTNYADILDWEVRSSLAAVCESNAER